MMRPGVFRKEYVTFRALPYQCIPETATGGVLPKGQVVWAGEVKPLGGSRVDVYIDGVGVVSVDPRWLVESDVLGPGIP